MELHYNILYMHKNAPHQDVNDHMDDSDLCKTNTFSRNPQHKHKCTLENFVIPISQFPKENL